MDKTRSQANRTAPVTLHGVMQEAIGPELRSRYKPEHEIPHHMLVLMMQLNEDDRSQSGTS